MKDKPKKVILCKSQGKAQGFKSCGKVMTEFEKREFGLCGSCRYEFYMTDERGKIEFSKRDLRNKKQNWNEQKKFLKEKTKTLSEYEADAKKSFQKFIRLRDEFRECISCGVGDNNLWDGGHYFKAELFSGLIFNENNCHKQCRKCNRFLNGNELQYRFGLIRRYGADYVANLESISNENRVYKFSKSELIEIKKKYNDKIKQLTK